MKNDKPPIIHDYDRGWDAGFNAGCTTTIVVTWLGVIGAVLVGWLFVQVW